MRLSKSIALEAKREPWFFSVATLSGASKAHAGIPVGSPPLLFLKQPSMSFWVEHGTEADQEEKLILPSSECLGSRLLESRLLGTGRVDRQHSRCPKKNPNIWGHGQAEGGDIKDGDRVATGKGEKKTGPGRSAEVETNEGS